VNAPRTHDAIAGFTLLETMLSLALVAAIVAALAAVTAQWLPNWRHSFADLQRADLLSLGLERIASDISSAEYVTPSSATPEVLFDGKELSVTFVRSAIGPDSHPHLEIIRIAETVDDRGFAVVRTRAPFTPLAPGASLTTGYSFSDPVVLVRAPFRISFGYAGPARTWLSAWGPDKQLPSAVRVTVRDAQSDQVLAASTAVTVKVTATGVPTPDPNETATAPGQAAATNNASQATTPNSPNQPTPQ
jgi:general secretion pathway protein J